MGLIYTRIPGESDSEMIFRVCKDHDIIGSWRDIAAILNEELGLSHTESKYRHQYQRMCAAQELTGDPVGVDKQMLNAIRIERRMLAEERNALRRQITEEARFESFYDAAKRAMAETVEPEPYAIQSVEMIGNPDAVCVVHLTDTHIGTVVDNRWNRYDIDIARERLHKYAVEIAQEQLRWNAGRCCIVLGGDMINGLIHFENRIESQETVVGQLKAACQLITEFVKDVALSFRDVDIYAVSGNHSRVVANKKEAIRGEDFDSLIPFYMAARLKFFDGVTVHQENEDPSFVQFDVFDHLFCAVHGDKDTPSTAVKALERLCDRRPDVVLIGHRHENIVVPSDGATVVQSGSLIGASNYTVDHRLSGEAAQWFMFATKEKPIASLIPVRF